MREVMIMVSAAMEPEEIALKVQEASEKYLADRTTDNRHELLFYCHVFVLNQATKGDMGKAVDLVKQIERHERQSEMFNPSGN